MVRVSGLMVPAVLIAVAFLIPLAGADAAGSPPGTAPYITIDPIGNHTTGDLFFINGTTNLPVPENLTIAFERYSDFFRPHGKNDPYRYLYQSDISLSPSEPGSGRWSVNVTDIAIQNLTGDRLIVWVYSPAIAADEDFRLFPAVNASAQATPATALPDEIPPLPPVYSRDSAAVHPAPRPSALSGAALIAALAGGIILVACRRKT